MMRKITICTLFLLFTAGVVAQDVKELSLDECINVALERNINLKRAKNSELISKANRFQAIMNFFPTLSAGINYDYFFGNFFDQNAARQVSETTNSSNPNISSNAVIFNGFSNQYLLKQRINEQRSAKANVENAKLNVRANILSSYLEVVLSKENFKIAEERVELLENQLDREEKRVSVGVGDLNTVYNLRSQLSNEKQNLIDAQNLVETTKLTLIQSMQLDPQNDYDVKAEVIVEEDLLAELEPFDLILGQALEINPSIEGAKADRNASKYALKSASAQRFPTISAFGRIGSNYSSNGARNPSTGEFQPNASFQEQLEFNEFEYVNFSLNIPIFNRWRINTDIQNSKVGVLNADLDYQDALVGVTNLVQRAYLDMINAQTSYSAAKENLDAQQSIFNFMKKRFETGNTDFNSYQESLTNKNRAELQLLRA
ncbi:MAG: TolC family protein, partial [Bacteroidota bacterium]